MGDSTPDAVRKDGVENVLGRATYHPSKPDNGCLLYQPSRRSRSSLRLDSQTDVSSSPEHVSIFERSISSV